MTTPIDDLKPAAPRPGVCPFDHSALSQRKTAREAVAPSAAPAVSRDASGVWQIHGYAQARAILRSGDTRQAGFKAELLERTPQTMRPPILYQEGQPHHDQRKATARFFTPRAVSERYRALMEDYADRVVARLRRRGQADLSELSMRLAVRVAAEVVGLTDSRLPGMAARLNAFFAGAGAATPRGPRALLDMARNQLRVGAFFLLDVRPAIEARRRQPREDVISHLLAQGYGDAEILTECITYAAAGMVTTREFICVAAWHLLEQPVLRARFLAAAEGERQAILQELLRLEPVVGRLYRRATADLAISDGDRAVTIPAGDLITLHVDAANLDEAVAGEYPALVCPARELCDEKAGAAVLSFGDGHHRCPGAYLALQETDIFLGRLLRLPGLRMERKPSVSWNELVAGYELRGFLLSAPRHPRGAVLRNTR